MAFDDGKEKKQSLADVSKKIRETGLSDEKETAADGTTEKAQDAASDEVAEPPAPKAKTPQEMQKSPEELLERDREVYRTYAAAEKKDDDPFRRAEAKQQESLGGRGGLPDDAA